MKDDTRQVGGQICKGLKPLVATPCMHDSQLIFSTTDLGMNTQAINPLHTHTYAPLSL